MTLFSPFLLDSMMKTDCTEQLSLTTFCELFLSSGALGSALGGALSTIILLIVAALSELAVALVLVLQLLALPLY